jgi:transcriptional regulator with XRE-family HTH domain
MAHSAIEQTPAALRAWRTRVGLDRAAAAEALGVSHPTYKSLENGAREVQSYHARLAALVEATMERALSVTHSDIHVIGGGTFSRVRHHFSLCAEAFGTTADEIAASCARRGRPSVVHLTRMADRASPLVTSEDVGLLVDRLVADPGVRVLFMNAALCDFDGQIGDVPSGKYARRLRSRDGQQSMALTPANKVIGRIRAERKDIFAVGFKTTAGESADMQYRIALDLLKSSSLNLVLANDPVTRMNMVVAPEEACYHQTTDRAEALEGLVEMTLSRSANTFTRSTVLPGESVPWSSEMVPDNLRQVVDHCIARGAYKPFRGVTAGHFAVRLEEGRILTSKRKHDFNRLAQEGMVLVEYEGRDRVLAHGFKPSVGGQSQRVVFEEHTDADCIVHFHAPLRADARDRLPMVDQWPNECGSHQCGQATSRGLEAFGNLSAVMLDGHGPNVVFSRHASAQEVVDFIEANFDLSQKTGGPVA